MKRGETETSFWAALSKFPPYYVRLLAKTGPCTLLSDADIAIASGIDLQRIRQINVLPSWDTVTVSELLRYTTACNFDPTRALDRGRIHRYEMKCKKENTPLFGYLRKSPRFESEILPLLKILRARMTATAATTQPLPATPPSHSAQTSSTGLAA